MNRRSFFLTASAGLALAGNKALAQRSSRGSSDILTSELTGGEVDVSGTSLPMVNQHIEEEDGSEHFHFEVEEGGQFDIIMFPEELGDPEEYMRALAEMYFTVMPGEIFAEDSFADGSWIAFDFAEGASVGYYEAQLNAYPGHHLVITFNSPVESFADNFEEAQAVLVDGMAPFLFHEESDILALAEERGESATAGTSSRTDRGSNSTETNSRSSRTSGTSDDDDDDNGGSRTSSGGGDTVATIQAHREEFMKSYNEFYDLLTAVTEETATDAEVEDGFAQLIVIAQDWQEYPDRAAEIEFSASEADLEATYIEWADLVYEMGIGLEDIAMGVGTSDAFLDAYDEWVLVDEDLAAQLEGIGFLFRRQAKNPATLVKTMHSVRFAA